VKILVKGADIMEITVRAIPDGMSTMATILSFLVLGVGIYLIFLLIKALQVYIKKNS
jgi:hypothetical protein